MITKNSFQNGKAYKIELSSASRHGMRLYHNNADHMVYTKRSFVYLGQIPFLVLDNNFSEYTIKILYKNHIMVFFPTDIDLLKLKVIDFEDE